MCGDGANDCGALKMAHAGISLSEAEASVASPFTSKKPNIECVPTLIREGRAALVTSVGIFKYMACYSLTQFCSVLLLYWIGANLTDFQFLYLDLVLNATLAVTFGRTPAYKTLDKELPVISLVTLGPILSLFLQMAVQAGIQVGGFLYIEQQPWFIPFVRNEEHIYVSQRVTVVFIISSFQYIMLALVFSKGAPYRKTVLSNYWFLGNLLLLLALNTWISVHPLEGMETFLEMASLPSVTFRLTLVGVAMANCFLSMIIETFFIETSFVKKTCQKVLDRCFSRPDHQYIEVGREIRSKPDWPPVTMAAKSLFATFQRHDSSYQGDVSIEGKVDYDSENSSIDGSVKGMVTDEDGSQQIRRCRLAQRSGRSDGYVTEADDIQLIENESTECRRLKGFTNVALMMDQTCISRKAKIGSEVETSCTNISTQL